MARRIDRAAGFLVLMVGGIAVFFFATGSLPIALILGFAWGVLIRHCHQAWQSRHLDRQNITKARARDAAAQVEAWTLHPNQAEALAHLRARYSDAGEFAFRLVPHAAGARAFDENALLDLWRNHASDERLVIAVTGKVDAAAFQRAASLKGPAVSLLDGAALTSALRRSGLALRPAPPDDRRPRLPRIVPSRKRAPFLIAYALFMVLAYWVTGAMAYLIGASLLLTLAGLALHKPKPPETLFP